MSALPGQEPRRKPGNDLVRERNIPLRRAERTSAKRGGEVHLRYHATMPSTNSPHTRHRAICTIAITLALAVAATACSGGGTPGSGKTSTVVAQAAAGTATRSAIDGPPPAAADVTGFINAGFSGLSISFREVGIPSFRKLDVLLKVLDDCDKGAAGGASKDSAEYWPIVLGDCYTVGDALGWLYQHTARKDFLYANLLMRRYNRQKFEQAVAAGAAVNEDYWKLVTDKIYSVTPITTPIAVTPQPDDATPVAP